MKLAGLLLALVTTLGAFDTVTASKIFEKIFTAMYDHVPIRVFAPDAEYRIVVTMAPSLLPASSPETSDCLLIDAAVQIPPHNTRVIFTTDPDVFRRDARAVGAFYWEHGRPRIIFLAPRLRRNGIALAQDFQRYVVTELP